MVMPVLISPSMEIIPTAPPYQRGLPSPDSRWPAPPTSWVRDDGHGPHVREKCVERIKAFAERRLDVIDGVNTRHRIRSASADHLHEPAPQSATCHCDDVGTHRQFGLFLRRIQHSRMLSASRNGSPVRRAVPAMGQVSIRRLDAHEHLGRRSNQLFFA